MLPIIDLGIIEYKEALAVQERAVEEVIAGINRGTLFLLEHLPVYTTGSGGTPTDEPPVLKTTRGGQTTYHGPGQLVGYPVLSLAAKPDLHGYLRFLEDVLIESLRTWGIEAYTVSGRTGVWTARGKIGSIGVGIRRWVTCHGFSLNVDNDLSPFARIDPCGIPGCVMTSVVSETGKSPGMDECKTVVSNVFLQKLVLFSNTSD